jgi:hypothetical protein
VFVELINVSLVNVTALAEMGAPNRTTHDKKPTLQEVVFIVFDGC